MAKEIEQSQEAAYDDSFDGKRPKIPKDDGFKTCQSELPAMQLRSRLRTTAARTSILKGGTPFKEFGSSGKKFNSRKKSKKLNDLSINSNDTYVRHERDIFDRDSLEYVMRSPTLTHVVENPSPRSSSPLPEPKSSPPKIESLQSKLPQEKPVQPKPRPKPQQRPEPRNIKKPMSVMKPPASTPRARKVQPKYLQERPQTRRIPIASVAKSFSRPPVRTIPRSVAMSVARTTTKSDRYKSTAELEKEYFNSLRSRF